MKRPGIAYTLVHLDITFILSPKLNFDIIFENPQKVPFRFIKEYPLRCQDNVEESRNSDEIYGERFLSSWKLLSQRLRKRPPTQKSFREM